MTDKTTDPSLTPDEENQALAAELALGLLDGEEAKAAVARLPSDPEFAQAVRDWQERLAALGDNVTSVMPPARAWQGIREKLGHSAAPLTDDPAQPLAWWRGPRGWLAGLVAIAAVVGLFWFSTATPDLNSPSTYIAELVSEGEELQVLASLQGGTMEVSLEQGGAQEGRDLEIWWVKPDGSDPISLGLVPQSGTAQLDLPEGLEPTEGIKIALSDEPAGGSPTGKATGPIVAIANLTTL